MGKKCIQRLVGEPERKRPQGNLNLDERMILKRILNKVDARVWNCTYLAHDMEQGRALVNTVMNRKV
jgi:hypothetical protein